MTYDKVSDEVLKQVAAGSGRCYPHEGKAMARELLEFRAARNASTPASNPNQVPSPWWGGIP